MEYITSIDQMGKEIRCPKSPEKIISLVPSQTEFLFDIGLENRIVGITKFCIHPKEQVKQYPKVGGTKKFNFKKIEELQPDLIIGNKEENYQQGIQLLKEKYPVWMSDISSLADSLDMMISIGRLVDKEERTQQQIREIKNGFEYLLGRTMPYKAIYLIWQKPNMVAGQETFINDLMSYAGFENVVTETRYPELTDSQIAQLAPDFILLSSEPYPFKQKHIEHFQRLSSQSKVILVDGEMFSWYGSRLRYAPHYFENNFLQKKQKIESSCKSLSKS